MFMATVDVPCIGRASWPTRPPARPPHVAEGTRDSLAGASHAPLEDWREEMPWMSLYFSAGVWISLSLIRAPRSRWA